MRGWLWSCRSSATASPTIRTHSSSRLPVSPPAAGAAATLFPHRYQRATTHLATTCQLHSRLCGHRTAMWQDRLAMWSPSGDADQLETGQAVDAGAQIRPHHTSQRRHRTHRVVRPHAEDTPRLYARRLRGRVFKRSPRLFVVTPLSANGDFGRCAFSKLARRRLGNGTGANPGAEPGFASPTCCRSAVGSLDLALLSLCRRTAALCAGVSHRCAGRCFALPRRLPGEPPPPPTARCQDSAVDVVGGGLLYYAPGGASWATLRARW